jgi:hypothetical protein
LNPWQGINQFLLTYREAFAAMGRIRTWAPFGLFFLVQMALLALLYFGVRPPFTDTLRLGLGFVLPESFFSYPMHLLIIPAVFYSKPLMILLGASLEAVLLGAATLMFVRFAARDLVPGLSKALREVRFGYLQFAIFWLVNFALLWGYSELYQLTLGELWIGFERRRAALQALNFGLSVLINCVLAYSTVIIVTEGARIGETLVRTVKTFGRHWFATIMIVAIGSGIVWPFQNWLLDAPNWIGGFNPEVMLAAIGINALVALLATYLMTAALTFWYLLHRRTS